MLKRSRINEQSFSDSDDEDEIQNVNQTLEKVDSAIVNEDVAPQLKKKIRIQRKRITENELLGPHGIRRIYDESKSFRPSTRGNEVCLKSLHNCNHTLFRQVILKELWRCMKSGRSNYSLVFILMMLYQQ